MNKKQAAERLGISTRLVERYDSEGRLGAKTYVRGKTGKQADWSEEAVEKLKGELEAPDLPATALQSLNVGRAELVAPGERERFLIALEAVAMAARPQLTLESRLFLSLKEAAQVAGLPRAQIKRAIDDGSLKAMKTGAGWRVRSEDLAEYARHFDLKEVGANDKSHSEEAAADKSRR
jgi:excisionase family DNA binding protein